MLGREVELSPDWWRHRGEPLVVEHEDLGPCFAFHRGGRWRGVRRPASGGIESIRIDAAFANACGSTAHEFIRTPLPGALGIRDLMLTAMFHRWSDLGIRLAAACLSAVVGVVLPLMTALVIDSVIPNGDLRGLVGVAAALVVAIGVARSQSPVVAPRLAVVHAPSPLSMSSSKAIVVPVETIAE